MKVNKIEIKKATEKINDKPLFRLTKIKSEDPNKIRNEREEITNITEIQKTERNTTNSYMPKIG